MKAILNIITGLFASIILLIYLIVLSLTPPILSFSKSITERENVLDWIDNSNIYDQIILKTIESTNENLKEEGLNTKEIKAIQSQIKKAITIDFVKSAVVSLVNGIYDWLDGKTENIEVQIQKIDIKTALTSFIPKEQLQNQDFLKLLNTLKPCTEAQAYKYEELGGFTSVDDFCIPPRLDLLKIADDSYDKNISDKVIDVSNPFQIPEIPQEQSKLIKDIYFVLSNAPIIFSLILIVLGGLYLFLFPGTYTKFYILGGLTLLNSLISLFILKSSTLLNDILTKLINSALSSDVEIEKSVILDISNSVLKTVSDGSIIYIYYILIASIVFISLTILVQYFLPQKELKGIQNPKK